jgi:leader peptidase (prepilin peptidase)/N-methyltransferase
MLAWQAPVAVGLFVLGVWSGVPPFLLPALGWLAATTPELVRVDLAEHRLPDRLTLPGYPLALAGIATSAAVGGNAIGPLIVGAAFLALLLLLSLGGGMGLGDVKLAGVLGLLLGAGGAPDAVAALLVAFFAGGTAALVVLARRGRSARLAFGPFLLAGFWIGLPLGVA